MFYHSKMKFISSRHRVISSMYSEERSGKIYSFVWRYFFVSSRNTSTWHTQVLRVCFQNKFYYELNKLCNEISENSIFNSQLQFPSCSMVKIKFIRKYLSVRNIPKFKDRANWSCDTFQPMRRRACVYQQTNQNIAAVIKYFQNSGRSRTESVIVSRHSGIFLRLFMRHTQFF